MLTSAQNIVTLNTAFQKTLTMVKYSITVVCPHDIAETRVIESIATCETTVLICIECGEELEKPKTDCT
jgi:50S ribosomal subunit-associated GTPase HflX